MGLVTRTIERSFVDLAHFILLFLFVTSAYSLVGHITFGSEIYEFSSISLAFETCMHFILGDLDVKHDMDFLPNKATVVLFFWSFTLIVFFILINVLLAILVDAYVDVKENAGKSNTILEDIWEILCTDFVLARNMYQRASSGEPKHFIAPATLYKCARFVKTLHEKIMQESDGPPTALVYRLPKKSISGRKGRTHQVRVGKTNIHVDRETLELLFEYGCKVANNAEDLEEEQQVKSFLSIFKHKRKISPSNRILHSLGAHHLAQAVIELFHNRHGVNDENLADIHFKQHIVQGMHKIQQTLDNQLCSKVELHSEDSSSSTAHNSAQLDPGAPKSSGKARFKLVSMFKRGTKPGTITIM